MNDLPVKQAPPIDRLGGIRDRFAEGGSAGEILFVVGILILVLLLAHALATFVRWRRNRQLNDPHKLLQDVLTALPLDVSQRDLVRRMAGDLRLEHPVAVLLSPQSFDRYSRDWLQRNHRSRGHIGRQLEQVKRTVFAGEQPAAARPSTSTTRTD